MASKNNAVTNLANRHLKVVQELPARYDTLKYDYSTIPEEHRQQVQRAALDIQRWQRDTIALGQTLLAVKELMPHRQFLEWLKVEFDMSERMLQHTMNVARVFDEPEKRNIVTLLSNAALYLLAAPSTPDTVRWYVLERVELTDWRPTRRDIQKLISAEKPPKERSPKQLPAGNPLGEDDTGDTIEAEYSIMPDVDRTVAMLADPATTQIQLSALFTEATADQLADALLLLPDEATLRHDMLYRQMQKQRRLEEARDAMHRHPGPWGSPAGAANQDVDLLARTIAVKGLLHEIEQQQPSLRQAVQDLHGPLKRLIGALEGRMK